MGSIFPTQGEKLLYGEHEREDQSKLSCKLYVLLADTVLPRFNGSISDENPLSTEMKFYSLKVS